MREILFRGKRKDNGEWVYGYGFYGVDQKGGPSACYILQKYSTDIVYPETVGQYTGLKDKNGAKIFDGDIILFDYENLYKNLKGVVSLDEYFHSCLKAINHDWKIEEFYIDQAKQGKIIGNIHDNPELLDREKEE